MRVSGPDTQVLAARLFHAHNPLQPRQATYGQIRDERGTLIDRGIALFARAPHSYTGEDTLELHVHGSPVITGEVLRALIACGARYALPGEFTQRAFLNGKLDLHAAGAVADLIEAEHRSAARSAVANLDSALAVRVRQLRARLAGILEELAGSIDYPDEVPEPDRDGLQATLQSLEAALRELLHDAQVGKLVRDGVAIAIAGPPNAGKSSLLNALLGEERAIVSEIAGTTRDTIEETFLIDGIPVRITDTAGIREHADTLEAAGIERTKAALARSRFVIVVLDGSQPLGAGAQHVLSVTQEMQRVVFFNKSDLGDAGARHFNDARVESLHGSTRDAHAIERVRRAIARHVWNDEAPDFQRPHLASSYEINAVARALEHFTHAGETLTAQLPPDLIAPDLQQAFADLGQLTGDAVTEELLTGVFARFCIGK